MFDLQTDVLDAKDMQSDQAAHSIVLGCSAAAPIKTLKPIMNMPKPPNTVAHDDKMRREPDDDEPLHKDCKIRVTGKPYG